MEDIEYEARERKSLLADIGEGFNPVEMTLKFSKIADEQMLKNVMTMLRKDKYVLHPYMTFVDTQTFMPLTLMFAVRPGEQLCQAFKFAASPADMNRIMEATGKFSSLDPHAVKLVNELLEKTHDIPESEDIVYAGDIGESA